MKDILDLHTHTLASGHAYSTIKEMAQEASQKGLRLLGITEHAPMMPGTCHIYYFRNLKALRRQMFGVDLLFGTELNIIDLEGNVDMDEDTLRQMDICIASFHLPCVCAGSSRENTYAAIRAMNHPCISVLGHPDDGRYPFDYEELVKGAKETNTILEINNSSLSPKSFRPNAKENDAKMLKFCMKYGVFVVMDSDAHVSDCVGEHGEAMALIKELGFPEELILNDKPEKIKELIFSKRSGL